MEKMPFDVNKHVTAKEIRDEYMEMWIEVFKLCNDDEDLGESEFRFAMFCLTFFLQQLGIAKFDYNLAEENFTSCLDKCIEEDHEGFTLDMILHNAEFVEEEES